MFTYFIVFHVFLSLLSLFFCRKFNILVDQKIEKHKKFSSSKRSHLIGGSLLFIFLIYYYSLIEENLEILYLLFSIYFLGLMSDLKKINSVSLRFFIQLILILSFTKILNIEIISTKIDFLDNLLEFNFFNVFFVAFCLLVLVNGSNFIDGINGFTISYYLVIFLILLLGFNNLIIDEKLLINVSSILFILLLINLTGYIYLGDSGSYLLSLFVGIFLINFASNNQSISPYFIIVLLWYPCFELLFSMLRRSLNEINSYKPDTFHLHHLIFKKLSSLFGTNNKLITHGITTISINSYNLFIFIISINFIYNSDILIAILTVNIILYIFLYSYLKKEN